MSIQEIIAAQERCTVSLIKTVLFAVALLMTSVATDAFAAGSISGRVTGSDAPTVGLQGTVIQVFNLDTNDNGPTAIATTDALGNYSANVPAGRYVVFTQDIHGYINEIWNNLPCSAVCNITDNDLLLNAVVVTNSAVTGINFVLDPGGRIRGHVSSSVAGNPALVGIVVNFTDPSGDFPFTKGVTDASGDFISEGGTTNGTVRAYTTSTLPYQDEIYDNIKFASGDVTTGTAITVTLAGGATGVNFILDPGGQISGTVRDASLAPLANIEVHINSSTGDFAGSVVTDASGNYITGGLAAGNYYLNTRSRTGLVDQLYNGVTCVNGNCGNPTQLGTAVPVTVPGTTTGINFTLSPGGTVSGTVTNAAGGAPISDAFVGFFTMGTGSNFGLTIFEGGASTNNLGQYKAVLPPGTHFAVVSNVASFANQLYNGLGCAGDIFGNFICNAASGTPITVTAGATTGNINFALHAGGAISGAVTNATFGGPLSGVPVQVFSGSGVLQGTIFTGASGIYTFTNLAVGAYYVRTNGGGGGGINQLYNGVVCNGCTVTTSGGTLIPVTAGGNTTGINFALTAGGHISGTITNAVGGAPISNVPVQIFGPTGLPMGTSNTNASGVYTSPGLPPGTYFVRTAVGAAQNFVDQLWNSFPCVPCTVTTGTPVTFAGTAAPTNINFALSAGGSISGTATDSGAGGATVPGMPILVWDSTGVLVKNITTDASGNYTATGLPNGNYLVGTNAGATQNYVRQMYNGLPFTGTLTTGTPVAVTVGSPHAGVNFAMSSGGSLSGIVTGVGAVPLGGVQVAVYSPAGRVVRAATTDATGAYTVTGLQAGTYYVSTSVGISPPPFYMDALYNNLSCLGCVTAGFLPVVTLPCTPSCAPPVTTGTPVAVTNGTTHSGVDFALGTGAGVISGTVKDAVSSIGLTNVQVSIYNAAGVVVKSVVSAINTGAYTVRGLAPGTYYARTVVSPATPHYTDVAFGNLACAPCNVTTTSTPITVAANSTTGPVDFAMSSGGSIAGLITDAATTNPLVSVDVQLFNASGNLVKTTFSGSVGTFTLDGLPAGTYYARTAVPSGSVYADKLYDNIACATCVVTTGTPIVVTNGATHAGVNFALLPRVATVVTAAATSISPVGATLNGTVNPNGTSTTATFQYGLTASYGSEATASPAPGSGTSPVAVSAAIAGLSCNTPYHFRAVATNPGGSTNGADLTFTTGGCPPTVVTGAPTSVTTFGATLNATVNPNGTSTAATFQYGLTTGYGSQVAASAPGSGTLPVAVSAAIAGLSCNTPYHFRATATNAVGAANGADAILTTGACVPTIAPIPNLRTRTNTPIVVPITVGGANGPAGLTLTGSSSKPRLVPNANLVFNGSGASRTLTITPSANQKGATKITVTASDSTGTGSESFMLVVNTKGAHGDFDGDGRADLTVFRPSSGTWFVLQSRANHTSATGIQWGNSLDKPVPGDYDGDGNTDIAIFRPSNGTWFIQYSGTGTAAGIQWGNGNDVPVPGDYDGDGKTDIAIFRPSTGTWFIQYSGTGTAAGIQWGNGNDVPVPGDYDGDGKTDIAIFRPSTGTWFIEYSGTGTAVGIQWGNGNDAPVPGDYDGDGKTDIAIFRPSTGTWFIQYSDTGTAVGIQWGNGSDAPVPGDYDGDGKTDIAIFRPSTGTWFIQYSDTGTADGIQWGNGNDVPILKHP